LVYSIFFGKHINTKDGAKVAFTSEGGSDMSKIKEAYDHLAEVIEKETGMVPDIEVILTRPNEGGIGKLSSVNSRL